jgi:hypothetical protein
MNGVASQVCTTSNPGPALNSLKETKAMRNEWDISPSKANAAPVGILPEVPGEGQTGYEAPVEAEEGRESLRRKIEAQLRAEPELKRCSGVFGKVKRERRRLRGGGQTLERPRFIDERNRFIQGCPMSRQLRIECALLRFRKRLTIAQAVP